MECNKDEALRAKQIAENKLQSGDFAGALKFASKAQRLYPDIQNIVQILTVCQVHCAAQNKVAGSDMDWYGILQIERFADEATIKKQYRKLALLLHPDKNKSAGAEAAFKLIGEANRVLCDQSKRSYYDMKFRVHGGFTAPKPPSHHPNHSSFGTNGDGNTRNHPNTSHSHSHNWNSHQQNDQPTFWTACQHCKTRYEYYRTIVNATLPCQQCSKNFVAHDLGPQGHKKEPSKKEPSKHVPPKASKKPASMSKCNAGVHAGSKTEKRKAGHVTAGVTKSGVGTSNPAKSNSKESQMPTNVGSKRARQSASSETGYGNDTKDANVQENSVDPSGLSAGNHRRSSRKKQHASYTETAEDDDNQTSSKRPRQFESNTTEMGGREVPASGGLFSNNNSASFTADVGGQNGEMRKKAAVPSKETVSGNKTKVEQSNVLRKEASKSDLDDRKSEANNSSPPNSNSPRESEIYCCPDPDFSDFEKDREEDCFAANQFWAVFDTDDSMPRYYALVKKVHSPFKLQITWLEVDPDNQSEMDWYDAGLPVGCGKFRLGGSQRTTDRFMFSHQVHSIKGSGKGPFFVYPNRGETWAIFKHWDFGWSANPEKHSEYQFEYVEVLSDFDEDGIRVAYLGKVKGFVSIFQRTMQNGITSFTVPPSELYRFSHRIPSYKMTGNEREGVPKGSFELDPAGIPSSLFEIGGPGDAKTDHRMLNGSAQKDKLRGSSDAERASSILRRSPRSNRDAVSQTNEKVKTPEKHLKNNHERETLEVRRSPRDLSKKNVR